jgi:PST family polysaccharide transporter
VTASLLVLAGGPLAVVFGAPDVAELIRWLSGVVLLNGLAAVPVALLKREMRFRSLTKRTFIGLLAGGVVGIGMAASGFGAWSLVGQMLTQAALQVAVVWPACGWRPGFRFDRRRLREVAAYGCASAGLVTVNALRQAVPRFFVGVTAGPLGAGLYQLAAKLAWTMRMALIYPVTVVAMPTAAKMQADPAMMSRLLVTASRYMAMITFPGFVGLAMVAPELMKMWGVGSEGPNTLPPL